MIFIVDTQDCMFLACAEQAGARLVTADLKLIQKAAERGFGHLVLGLDAAIAHFTSDTHRDT